MVIWVWLFPGRSIRSVFGMLYGPLSGCSITDCILTYIMYCTARLSQYTAFHQLHRKLRAVNWNIRATQCIIYVRIQPVILHPLNGPYTDPFSSTWVISVLFCAGTVYTSLLIQGYYANRWLSANQSFQACPKIALLLICSSICNQIASVVACRPIEIFSDPGYIFMIAMQLGGFFLVSHLRLYS